MSKHEGFKKEFFEVFRRAQEKYTKIFIELIRNSAYSKSADSKKLLALVQILSFS